MASPIKHRLPLQKFTTTPKHFGKKKLIMLIVILAISYQLLAISCFAQSAKYVRVAVIQDTESLSFMVSGLYEITDSGGKEVLYRGKNLNTTVTTHRDNILVGAINLHTKGVLIKAYDSEAILINGS